MSNTKKTVKIKENDLVELIDNILNEALVVKKQEWISEQAKKTTNKTAVLEGKLAALEAKVQKLTEGKK
jgi:BMFP domain-containing protein YqiC